MLGHEKMEYETSVEFTGETAVALGFAKAVVETLGFHVTDETPSDLDCQRKSKPMERSHKGILALNGASRLRFLVSDGKLTAQADFANIASDLRMVGLFLLLFCVVLGLFFAFGPMDPVRPTTWQDRRLPLAITTGAAIFFAVMIRVAPSSMKWHSKKAIDLFVTEVSKHRPEEPQQPELECIFQNAHVLKKHSVRTFDEMI